MIGLDTNVILRYLRQDDAVQAKQVNRIIDRELSEENPGYISVATVLELVWVLRSLFKLPAVEIAQKVEDLLAAEFLKVENEQQVFEAAYALRHGTGEFEDALIGALNAWAGCRHTLTFDRRAGKLGYFRLIP